jgi:hypothetical protein
VRDDFLDVSAGGVLPDLAALMATVQDRGFNRGVREFFGDDSLPLEPLGVVGDIAERLLSNLDVTMGTALFKKSLQEACLEAGGLAYDLDLLDIELGFKKFLLRHGVNDFIQRVLELYVFHSIWISLQDDAPPRLPDAGTFQRLISLIRTMSQAAVAGVLERARTSGQLDGSGIAQPEAGVQLMSQIRDCVLNFQEAG